MYYTYTAGSPTIQLAPVQCSLLIHVCMYNNHNSCWLAAAWQQLSKPVLPNMEDNSSVFSEYSDLSDESDDPTIYEPTAKKPKASVNVCNYV